jgi:predicted ester cyclase
MSPEQNKAIARRIPLEIFNQGKLDLADEIFAPDYIEHAQVPPGFPMGIPGLKLFVAQVRAAFPDFRYTIEDELAEGDKVVLRLTASGTQQGEFAGIPATGKRATWGEIHIATMQGGKLTEHWVNLDQLGMLQQLGVIPAPGS